MTQKDWDFGIVRDDYGVRPAHLPMSTAAQRVVAKLWDLHDEKHRINKLVLEIGEVPHIWDAWVRAMNAYRDAWKSNKARIREALRAECERQFKAVEELIEAHNRGEAPPQAKGSQRSRIRRQQ
jgi:hypothetical protein